jgi:PhzF family phenazine biosynthesis protein
MKYQSLLCFGRSANGGNEAIVVEDFSASPQDRQQFATLQNVPATVYLDIERDGTIALDYYYPHTRSPLCLHATLAAAAVLFERMPNLTRTHVVSAMHRQPLEIERDDDVVLIGLSPQPSPVLTIDSVEIAQLLHISVDDVEETPSVASVGSPKLLVRVTNEAALRALAPDLAGIHAWSKQHRVSGFYVYCAVGDGLLAGRNFNHLSLHLEDAATGVAAGALALKLARDITVFQGDVFGRPCTLTARYTPEKIQVGGRAVRP